MEQGAKIGKEAFRARAPALREELLDLQFELLSTRLRVLLVLAGDDRDGLAELMDLAHEWLDARLLQTGVLSDRLVEEDAYPPLWRFWRDMPRRGHIGIFYGGWPMAPIADRVQGRIDEAEALRRVEHGARLERMLAEDGALILKVWLHVPRKRLEKRLRKARKRELGWRRVALDQLIYDRYDELTALGEEVVRRTEAPYAPWLVVDSTDDEHRDLTVMETLRTAMAERLASLQPDTAPRAADPPAVALPSGSREPGVLDGVDLSSSLSRKAYEERLDALQDRLCDLSLEARDRGLATVLVFEGWDAAGKGGAIRRLTAAMPVSHYRVVPIAAPDEEERAHHYLWRFWRALPRDGRMVLFDRSWYGRVLVERVEGFARAEEWQRAFGELADFEAQLVEHGMLVRKFWLHIDPEEQLRRFRAREQTGYKRHKITPEDYRNRDRWDDYARAVDDMVRHTHSEQAPWILVAANDKLHARVSVLEAVCSGLEERLEGPS